MPYKANILVVDDEINIIESLVNILSDEGYLVSSTQSGDEALYLLQKESFDLVLLDIWLPGKRDGLQTLREIRRRGINTEVIMISGHGSIDTAVRATKLGAVDFIEKPLSLDSLMNSIESALISKTESNGKPQGEQGYDYLAVSPEMKSIWERLATIAKDGEPLLIYGEPGTGKEFTALNIHWKSSRKDLPFIKVDSSNLITSAFERLFGHLDEELSSQSSKFSKLTGTVYILNPQLLKPKLQGRLNELITSAKRRHRKNLSFIGMVELSPSSDKVKDFRNGLDKAFTKEPIQLPPLRRRKKDLEALINYFVKNAAEDFRKPYIKFSDEAMQRMLNYAWPGNVKALQSAIENMILACTSDSIEISDIQFGSSSTAPTKEHGGKSRREKTAKALSKTAVPQRTISKSAVLTGLGLFSGTKTGLIISPLPVDSGIIFSDVASGGPVSASLDNVESTEYATSLRIAQTSIKTVEHIMATLHMYGITNALLKVSDEIPIMDGSAKQFCEMIESAGIVEQDGEVEPIIIKEKIVVGKEEENSPYMIVEPSKKLQIEYLMDYPQPIGKLRATFNRASVESFKNEIAPARTFGFVKDVKAFETKGFAQGGKLSNIILVDEEKIVNTTLRFEDEFARHKVLDVLGDFYLLGRPIIGKITAHLSGHSLNIKMLREIRNSLIADKQAG